MIQKAGDVDGVTLKNNSKDYFGQNITVAQFYKRVERIWPEGGRTEETACAYAHVQDNKRVEQGGNDTYSDMQYPNFDNYSGYNSYTEFNDARGNGYDNLSGLNNLSGVNIATIAEINLLLGKSSDPTNGALQWRGTLSAYNLVSNYWLETKEIPVKALGTEYSGYYISNPTFIKTKNGYHVFFNFTRVKPEKPFSYEPYKIEYQVTDSD